MEIKQVAVADRAIIIKGTIMGAMPMKAFVTPDEVLGLILQLGVWKTAKIVWLLMTSWKR